MKLFSCPRCRKGKLYSGLLKVAPACDQCGLSYIGHEEGDGPAFFGILIIGAAAAIGAAIMEVKYEASFLLQAAIWVPFIFIGSIFSLRVGKAALIAIQFQLRSHDFSSPPDGGVR